MIWPEDLIGKSGGQNQVKMGHIIGFLSISIGVIISLYSLFVITELASLLLLTIYGISLLLFGVLSFRSTQKPSTLLSVFGILLYGLSFLPLAITALINWLPQLTIVLRNIPFVELGVGHLFMGIVLILIVVWADLYTKWRAKKEA